MCRAPGLSAVFGLVIVLISAGVAALAWSLGRFALLAMLLSGFVFVAPLLGVGLYGIRPRPRRAAARAPPTPCVWRGALSDRRRCLWRRW